MGVSFARQLENGHFLYSLEKPLEGTSNFLLQTRNMRFRGQNFSFNTCFRSRSLILSLDHLYFSPVTDSRRQEGWAKALNKIKVLRPVSPNQSASLLASQPPFLSSFNTFYLFERKTYRMRERIFPSASYSPNGHNGKMLHQVESQELRTTSSLLCEWQEPNNWSFLCLPSFSTFLGVEQLELKLSSLIRDAGIAGGSLACYVTSPAPFLSS